MIARVLLLAVAALLGTASASTAQSKEPLPLAVLDARVASVGLPTSPGWTPPIPQGTEAPGRTLGLDLGGHVYLLRGKLVSLGIGAALVFASSTSTSPPPASSAAPSLPDVTTELRTLAPQLSLNFGHRHGWSYLSGGIGRVRVTSEASRPLTATSPSIVTVGWAQAINYGGGARWFVNDHIALSLDLRWHRLPSLAASTTSTGVSGTSVIVAGGGISIK